MRKSCIFLTNFVFSLVCTATLFAESFRVRKLFPLSLTGTVQDEQTVTIGINDSIAIFLPDDATYLEGIEVKITIPDEIAAWQDSVACAMYHNIMPVPATSQIDYSGTRIFVRTLPARRSWIVQIPLFSSSSFKESAYATKLDVLPDTEHGFVFIRFQLAMKGLPDETMNATLKVTIKPILTNKGKLLVSTSYPGNELLPYTLFIDGNKADPDDEGWILPTGVHDVSIVSEFYRNETRTTRVEQAKITQLSVQLKSVTPTLLITAPANTIVYLDDEKCNEIGKEFEIDEGEHTVRFLMGDYEMIRTITMQKGKSYTAALAVDVDIREE
ncbi:MAG: hypothetical protein J6I73_08090 [Treponema sp.]|nr:hypothetical protein [Treponema sp.]